MAKTCCVSVTLELRACQGRHRGRLRCREIVASPALARGPRRKTYRDTVVSKARVSFFSFAFGVDIF